MASAEKTLRLIFPDWQHGANPGSGFVPGFWQALRLRVSIQRPLKSLLEM